MVARWMLLAAVLAMGVSALAEQGAMNPAVVDEDMEQFKAAVTAFIKQESHVEQKAECCPSTCATVTIPVTPTCSTGNCGCDCKPELQKKIECAIESVLENAKCGAKQGVDCAFKSQCGASQCCPTNGCPSYTANLNDIVCAVTSSLKAAGMIQTSCERKQEIESAILCSLKKYGVVKDCGGGCCNTNPCPSCPSGNSCCSTCQTVTIPAASTCQSCCQQQPCQTVQYVWYPCRLKREKATHKAMALKNKLKGASFF